MTSNEIDHLKAQLKVSRDEIANLRFVFIEIHVKIIFQYLFYFQEHN